jgi:hypothetical protein
VPYAKHKSTNGLTVSRVDGCQFWTTFNQNHTQKFGLSVGGCLRRRKMNDSRHLQHCRAVVWDMPANFVRWAQRAVQCSKICANLLCSVLHVFSDKFHVQPLYDRICGPTKWYVYMYVCTDQNEYCIAVCTELKEQAKNDSNFISNFITCDESWVFGYNCETKQQLSQWRTPTSWWPKKAQQVQCFWGGGGIVGILHKELVPPGPTVNCDLPRRLRENVQCKRSDKWYNSWALHHDNTPAHTSLVRQFLASMNMTVMPHPSRLTGPHPLWFFPIPKTVIEAQGATFWQH